MGDSRDGFTADDEGYIRGVTRKEQLQDNPVEPSHYTSMGISPLEYIEANPSAFTWCTANVVKYVSRAKMKNGLEDLKKAAWYLNHEIESMEKQK